MSVTIKKADLTRVLTVTHGAISASAIKNDLRPIEMRVLMCIVDNDAEDGVGIDTDEIRHYTGIIGSNIRHALYQLEKVGMIAFIKRQRGQLLIVTQTALGLAVAQACRTRWEEEITA